MAASLRQQDGENIPIVEARSRLYGALPCDESAYISAVLGQWAVPWTGYDDLATEPDPQRHVLMRSMRYFVGPRPAGLLAQTRDMVARGYRVQLTGDGGDALFASGPLPLDKALRPRGDLGRYVWWASGRSWKILARRVRRDVVRRRVPIFVLRAYLRLKRVEPADGELLTPTGRALYRQLIAEQPSSSGDTDLFVDDLWNPGFLSDAGLEDAITLRSGFEKRMPFLDIHLIEVVLDVPLLVHRWKAQWRALQKVAFEALYPPVVAQRDDKAEFTEAILAVSDPSPIARSELAERGLIDLEATNERLRDIARGPVDGRSVPFAWGATTIRDFERWCAQPAGRPNGPHGT